MVAKGLKLCAEFPACLLYRMLDGINNMKNIIQHSAQLLLTEKLGSYDSTTMMFDVVKWYYVTKWR